MIAHLRWKHKVGPIPIAARLDCAPSAVYQVLRRCGLHRLTHLDRVTGQPVRHYEQPTPAR